MSNLEPYKGIAGIYEEIRPSYPGDLIRDIITTTGINKEDKLLEIGAGTGKATIQFADQGYQIRAIEIGQDMADILSNKCMSYSNVTIDVTSFEDWICNVGEKFDMIYSAQSFHWIGKEVKYQKCYNLLKDKGFLVLFWYSPSGYRIPEAKAMDDQINKVVKKYTEKYLINENKAERLTHTGVFNEADRKAEIEESGLFRIIMEGAYTHKIKNTPGQYLMALKSVPAFASVLDRLEADIIYKMDCDIEEIIINHGGYVEEEFFYSLYIAQKI